MGGRTTGTQDSEADSGTGSVCEEEADDQVRPSLIDFPALFFHILNGFVMEHNRLKGGRLDETLTTSGGRMAATL